MIIGVDLGNYAIKTSKEVHFLSKMKESNGFIEEKEITYEGKKILVGEGEFQTDFNKTMKENTLPLLFSALALSDPKEQYFQVVLGLPIQQYKTNKRELIDFIEENRVKEVIIDGHKRHIVITDVEVAPEGASVYYNLTVEQKNKLGNKQLIIVDIGGRTTDVCLFKDKRIKEYKTIPVGMLNIYADIVSVANERYTESFKLEEGEDILKDGLFLNGEQKDISFITPILKKHFDSIYKELQLSFEVNKGYVLLTGGGSSVLKRPFQNRLNNLIVSSDYIFDNVKGFKKVGEELWQVKDALL